VGFDPSEIQKKGRDGERQRKKSAHDFFLAPRLTKIWGEVRRKGKVIKGD